MVFVAYQTLVEIQPAWMDEDPDVTKRKGHLLLLPLTCVQAQATLGAIF